MSVEDELRDEIATLRGEVAELRAQQWNGPPRLGPRPETQEEIDRRTARLVDAVSMAVNPSAPAMCTTNGKTVAEVRASQTNDTGQHDGYLVLCPDERAKGFIRPYRDAYQHVGERPTYPTVPLTAEQHERYDRFGYVVFEPFPPDAPASQGGTSSGRYWTAAQLKGGCGSVTTMGRALSETYARDPKFYGSTFCVRCNRHLPVAEFVWTADGQQVGS